jgi:acetyltransferase-like isoleucine patch superfamily enzyme
MNNRRFALRLHAGLAARINRLRLAYFRRVLGAPDLMLYFPFYAHPIDRLCIGQSVAISAFVHIVANGGVSIGDNTIIASAVQIASSTHDYHVIPFRARRVDAPVVIGRNVWIGAGAIVLPGITIGDNSVVGAGSVVTSDVPSGSVVAGVPARVRRTLDVSRQPNNDSTVGDTA